MKINHHLLLLIAALLSLLLLQNCGPGDCEQHVPTHTKYTISEADKSKIPFTGTDTLVYISNHGDTAILYGQGKRQFIDPVQQNSGGDPSCPKIDYDDFENIEFIYKGNNPYLNYMFIDFNASVNAPKQTNADIKIGDVIYSTYLGALNYLPNYEDTVTVGSLVYQGMKMENNLKIYCIYNLNYGFLKISTPNNIWLKKL